MFGKLKPWSKADVDSAMKLNHRYVHHPSPQIWSSVHLSSVSVMFLSSDSEGKEEGGRADGRREDREDDRNEDEREGRGLPVQPLQLCGPGEGNFVCVCVCVFWLVCDDREWVCLCIHYLCVWVSVCWIAQGLLHRTGTRGDQTCVCTGDGVRWRGNDHQVIHLAPLQKCPCLLVDEVLTLWERSM